MFPHLPFGMEWVVILVVGLLVFGRRMPEVARSLGKSIIEFKKGMQDVRDEIDVASKSEHIDGPRQPARLENATGVNAVESSPNRSTVDAPKGPA